MRVKLGTCRRWAFQWVCHLLLEISTTSTVQAGPGAFGNRKLSNSKHLPTTAYGGRYYTTVHVRAQFTGYGRIVPDVVDRYVVLLLCALRMGH